MQTRRSIFVRAGRTGAHRIVAGGLLVATGMVLVSTPVRSMWALPTVSVLLAVLAIVAVHRRPTSRGWELLAAGIGIAAAADVALALSWPRPPYPVSDVEALRLASWALFIGAYGSQVRERLRGSAGFDPAAIIDAAIVSITGLVVLWSYVVGPAVASGDGNAGYAAVMMVFAACFAVQASLVHWLRLSTTVRHGPDDFLRLGLRAQLLIGLYVGGRTGLTEVDAVTGWLAVTATALLVGALWHPDRDVVPPRVERPEPGPFHLGILTAVSMLCPALLVVSELVDGPVHPVLVGSASVVLFGLVLLRMLGLVRRVRAQRTVLAHDATTDGLTGIANRRAWDEHLFSALDSAGAAQQPATIALIDLDLFKQYNDDFGHQAGDDLLRRAAASWSTALRPDDLLARYGGEEFALLLPASTEAAVEVLQRMRDRTPHGITFSAGVAQWDGRSGPDDVVALADARLYAAKRAGRDRVVAAAPPRVAV